MTLQDALRGSTMSAVRRAVLLEELARLDERIGTLRPCFDAALDAWRETGSCAARIEADGAEAVLLPLVAQSEHIRWMLETEDAVVC
ncbi:hypothetical protein [Cupriavidus malaysiensis]|uniref:hypothetical protein n=1 Tax=Cupriavidus malaysiensis TaxID=367825 RepID=UPI0012FF8BF9|nr:hypothetical protein [Cupriavidus malaysiensis]